MKRDTRILLTSETMPDYGSGRFLRLSAHPVYIIDGEVRNFVDGVMTDEPFADLRITAQHDERSSTGPYSWRVDYFQPYTVGLRRAETMVKTLRRIDRRMAAMQTELGYPESYAAYVARVGKVLGVKSYGWRSEEMTINGTHYQWHGADWIVDIVQRFVTGFERVTT